MIVITPVPVMVIMTMMVIVLRTLGGLDHNGARVVLGPLEGRWHDEGRYFEVAIEKIGAAGGALSRND